MEKRDHLARVTVTDETWTAFREAAGRRRVPVARYLAGIVEREVTRLRAAEAKAEELSVQEAVGALEEVKGLVLDLDNIANRLEWAIRWGRTDSVPPAPR